MVKKTESQQNIEFQREDKGYEELQNDNVENEPEKTVDFPWLTLLYTFLIYVMTGVNAYMYFVLHKEKTGVFLPYWLLTGVMFTCVLIFDACRFIKQEKK